MLCECINVVVPVEVIERRIPGGVVGYRRSVPNATFCSDGSLTRVGFMTPLDTQMWAEEVQSFGVRFLDEDGAFVEMAVVDGLSGLTCPCPWLHLDIIDTVMWAWLAGMPSGELVVPAGWERPEEGSMRFIPNEEMEGLPVVARSGIDVLADPETGEPVYVGRPFEAAQDYDVILRRAEESIRNQRWDEAIDWLQFAATIRPLDEQPAGVLQALRERHGRSRRAPE
ncbi:MAG: hypothetical protein QG671_1197 [Actinomycetota bacterium]|nr:hypothetical protein [Actinomycetota bacterium]